jgi:hypothetical protein
MTPEEALALLEAAAQPASGPADCLERLRAVRRLQDLLDDIEVEAVINAKRVRCSWDEIGGVWGGVSRQAAHQRWAHRIDE